MCSEIKHKWKHTVQGACRGFNYVPSFKLCHVISVIQYTSVIGVPSGDQLSCLLYTQCTYETRLFPGLSVIWFLECHVDPTQDFPYVLWTAIRFLMCDQMKRKEKENRRNLKPTEVCLLSAAAIKIQKNLITNCTWTEFQSNWTAQKLIIWFLALTWFLPITGFVK